MIQPRQRMWVDKYSDCCEIYSRMQNGAYTPTKNVFPPISNILYPIRLPYVANNSQTVIVYML